MIFALSNKTLNSFLAGTKILIVTSQLQISLLSQNLMSNQSGTHTAAMSDRLAFPTRSMGLQPNFFFYFFVEFFRKITVETVKQT